MSEVPGPDSRPVRVHVAASGNAFMVDLATWLVEAAELAGWRAQLVTGRLPSDADAVNLVVAPHELYPLLTPSAEAFARAAAISVPVCTEQPGTSWFRLSAELCRPSPFTLDINPHGVHALRHIGVRAERLALGGVPGMVAECRDARSRPVVPRR